MTTQHLSRAQWAQIESRVRHSDFTFDPKWKCLIDGKAYRKCTEHGHQDQLDIIVAVNERVRG